MKMKYFILLSAFVLLVSCDTPKDTLTMKNDSILELVYANNIEGVKNTLENGVNINTTDTEGRSLLLLATINKQTELAKYLVTKGADVNLQAKNLDSAFLYAGASGQTELVQLYLEHGARFDIYNRYYGTALIPACERGYVNTVSLLAQTPNFPINHVNKLGWTALLEAIILGDGSEKYQQIVEILLKNGANPNITDDYGVTPLQHAINKKQTKITELLK
jgi:uncharacterized protein